jgi:EmrB/QacA subfamily drug resistance transporter
VQTNRSLVLACVMLAMFMVAIEATIVATAMPAIVAKLGSFNLFSWVFSGFLLTQTATTVMFGKMADLYGRRPVLIVGILIFLAGSVLCGFAWSMPSLIAFRLLQGVGAGSMQPLAMTIIGDLYTPEERGSIQGYLSSVWGISAVLGPLAGGFIVQAISWHWVFWINVPVGILTIFGLTRFLHENVTRKKHSIDYLGAALFTVAISAIMLALTQVSERGITDPMVIVSAVLFLICTPLFLCQEKRTAEPMLDLTLWGEKLIASCNAASVGAGMTLMAITGFLAMYVQGVLGKSSIVAGLALTMMAVGWPIASVLSRRFYRWMGLRGTLRLGAMLVIVGSVILLTLTPSSSVFMAGLGSGVTGFGMGFLVVTSVLLIQGSVPWQRRGGATASNVFARTLGSTVGAAILGSVLNYGLRSQGVQPERVRGLLMQKGAPIDSALVPALHYGLHLTFWIMAITALLTAILALMIPSRELHELGT